MAQTKLQKQKKALRYWEDKFLNHPRRFDYGYSQLYIKHQILNLTNKIEKAEPVMAVPCVLCKTKFIISTTNIGQKLCVYCRGSLPGVSMVVQEITASLELLGIADNKVANNISQISTNLRPNRS